LAAIPRELIEQAQARGIDPQVFQSMVLEQIEQQRRQQQQQQQQQQQRSEGGDEQQHPQQQQQQQQQHEQQRTPPPAPRPLVARRVVPTPPPPPRRDDADALNARLLDLLASKTPSAAEVGRLREAFEAVERTLLARWPGARLRLFGSAANGLALSGSNDIDVCLELDGVEDTKEAKGE
jgi:DNA polymerase sigma